MTFDIFGPKQPMYPLHLHFVVAITLLRCWFVFLQVQVQVQLRQLIAGALFWRYVVRVAVIATVKARVKGVLHL